MQKLTDELHDADRATVVAVVEDRRHRVPDLWEAVRSGREGGTLTFPRL